MATRPQEESARLPELRPKAKTKLEIILVHLHSSLTSYPPQSGVSLKVVILGTLILTMARPFLNYWIAFSASGDLCKSWNCRDTFLMSAQKRQSTRSSEKWLLGIAQVANDFSQVVRIFRVGGQLQIGLQF